MTQTTIGSSEQGAAVHAPRLGRTGDPCRSCSAPLASDQRYCLNCGSRRSDAPLRFLDEAGTAAAIGAGDGPFPAGPATGSPVGGAIPPTQPRAATAVTAYEHRPAFLLAAVATMLLALGVGVLIGNAGDGQAPKPTVISVGGAAPAAAAPPAATAAFTSDWPAGKEGHTIQLQLLPKASTTPAQVAAATADATAKGIAAVGALDSDQYPSLPAGSYLVYSGVYDTAKAAKAALGAVSSAFPGAAVVTVGTSAATTTSDPGASGKDDASSSTAKDPEAQTLSDDALDQKQNANPDDFLKQSKKLPDKVQSEGAPPAKDSKPAGGGSEAETFG